VPTANILRYTAAYGHVGYLVRCDENAPEWLRSLVSGLASYPLIDEEEHSEVEQEWQDEAAEDLVNEWTRRLGFDVDDKFAAETFWALVRCEAWHYENSGAYLDSKEQARVYPLWREAMFRASVTALVTHLVKFADPPEDNEYGESEGTMLTIGTDDYTDYGHQTGDNSFTGGAYGYPYWGVTYYDSDSDVADVVDDLMRSLDEVVPD
jgi:hypothetical protein